MIDHDVVVFLPVEEVEKMMNDGLKSFNIKMLKDKSYNITVIPSKKRRVFLDSDYSILVKENV